MLGKLLQEERAQGEWSSLYLILVFMIAALLVILLIKPMFRQSQTVIKPVVQAAGP
jgi:hypothetical protein